MNDVTVNGIGIGSALAIAISWSSWHSIWWAILHGICGWGYVVYWAIEWQEKMQ